MPNSKTMQRGLEQQLRDKYRKIVDENLALRETMGQGRDLEPDLADRASTSASQDWNMIRYNRNISLLKDIDVALKAIANDSYGLCEMCGEYISERRLVAMPSARLCVECQEMVDRNPGEFMRTGIAGEVLAAV